MTYRRRTGARRPPKKPQDAASGVLFLRKFMLKLYDREDGHAADWPLIAETLLREAFYGHCHGDFGLWPNSRSSSQGEEENQLQRVPLPS